MYSLFEQHVHAYMHMYVSSYVHVHVFHEHILFVTTTYSVRMYSCIHCLNNTYTSTYSLRSTCTCMYIIVAIYCYNHTCLIWYSTYMYIVFCTVVEKKSNEKQILNYNYYYYAQNFFQGGPFRNFLPPPQF